MSAARLAGSAMLAAMLWPAVSFAQEKQGADERRALLDRAQSARTASRHGDALDLARKAADIKPSSSLRRFIAEELAALGRHAEAYNEAKRCTEDAAGEAPSPNHDVVFLGCRSLVHDLAGRVALLSFDWGGAPPDGLEVTVNGEPLDQASEHAVPPGAIVIEASAPDKKRISRKVEISGGEVKVVEVRFEGTAVGANPTAPAVAVPHAAADPAPSSSFPRGRLWGPVVGAVGLAGVATGAILLAVSQSKFNSLEGSCPPNTCSETDHQASTKQIQTLDTWGNVTLVSGLGLAAVGAVWFVLDRRPAASAGAGPWQVGVSPGRVALYKTF